MIKKIFNNLSDDSGTMMIESTYCMIAAIFVLIFIMGLGFILYQSVMFNIACNQCAEEVVQTYKLMNVTHNYEVTKNDVVNVGKYRYFLGQIQKNSKDHLNTLVNERLAATSFALDDGTATVDIKPHIDDIGRRHYAITITKPYKFLFHNLFSGKMFSALNINSNLRATVYVEGADMLGVSNTVEFTEFIFRYLEEKVKILDVLNKFLTLGNDICGLGYNGG